MKANPQEMSSMVQRDKFRYRISREFLDKKKYGLEWVEAHDNCGHLYNFCGHVLKNMAEVWIEFQSC